jgi:hypothetical protein
VSKTKKDDLLLVQLLDQMNFELQNGMQHTRFVLYMSYESGGDLIVEG